MKALSLFSFPFTWYKKTTFKKVPFPVALEKSQVLQTFQALRRNNSVVSGCTEGTEILCVRLVQTSSASETQRLLHGQLFMYPSPHRHNHHRTHSNGMITSGDHTTVVESLLHKVSMTYLTLAISKQLITIRWGASKPENVTDTFSTDIYLPLCLACCKLCRSYLLTQNPCSAL